MKALISTYSQSIQGRAFNISTIAAVTSKVMVKEVYSFQRLMAASYLRLY